MANGKVRSIRTPVVLAVEDHKYNQMVLQKMIESIGIPVLTASNGKEAVEILSANNDIELVLMDLKMPVMDGYEALNEIKKLKPHTVVIAETAYALPGDKEKILKAGFDDYLPKPITLEILKNTLLKYLPVYGKS